MAVGGRGEEGGLRISGDGVDGVRGEGRGSGGGGAVAVGWGEWGSVLGEGCGGAEGEMWVWG
jgi:hypothetical protein